MMGADMEKTIVGKLARVNRLRNTKNGGPMWAGDIVTMSGELVHFRTLPDSAFSYAFTLSNYAGAFGRWHVSDWRGKTRIVGVDFCAPPDRVIFSHILG
jgi:hypothetical protein